MIHTKTVVKKNGRYPISKEGDHLTSFVSLVSSSSSSSCYFVVTFHRNHYKSVG